jgi:hypothetical protein
LFQQQGRPRTCRGRSGPSHMHCRHRREGIYTQIDYISLFDDPHWRRDLSGSHILLWHEAKVPWCNSPSPWVRNSKNYAGRASAASFIASCSCLDLPLPEALPSWRHTCLPTTLTFAWNLGTTVHLRTLRASTEAANQPNNKGLGRPALIMLSCGASGLSR